MTPLTWCCYAGYTDSVEAFVADARTDVNLVVNDEQGNFITALDIAQKIGAQGEDAAKVLRSHGALTMDALLEKHDGIERVPGLPPKGEAEEAVP